MQSIGKRFPGVVALDQVDFAVKSGEIVALVGENGAGKTTLTKLLARLYDPTEGRILLDGVDLREYDLRSLRQAIGVIFQDFVEYDLRFDENIGVGEIGKVQEYLDATETAEPFQTHVSSRPWPPPNVTTPPAPGSYAEPE